MLLLLIIHYLKNLKIRESKIYILEMYQQLRFLLKSVNDKIIATNFSEIKV